MIRWIRAAARVIAPIALTAFVGCVADETDKDRPLSITGTVTYHGAPVKKGAIHFLPVDPANPSASGAIADGEIRDVFRHKPGDGIRPGKYKIAITSFDDAFLESVAKRDGKGPDPNEVLRAYNSLGKLIPRRYNNARESGLTAEVSPTNRVLRLDLAD